MVQYRAVTKYVRVSPRKARLAAGLIRGLLVGDARLQLQHSGLRAGRLLIKTLDSAIANAESRSDVRAEQLQVMEVRVDEGPRMKRTKSRSKGMRHAIVKKMSHFTIVVASQVGSF